MTFPFRSNKKLERGIKPGVKQTWIPEDSSSASVSVCALRKTPDKELLVAFTGPS